MAEVTGTAHGDVWVSCPDEWTPEQVADFQEEWDRFTSKHQARWLPAPVQRPQVVLHLWWSDGSISRQETYGPWVIAEDESHLEQVYGFLRDWRKVTGCQPDVATMAIVMDPATWIREREQQGGSDGGD